MNCDMFKSNNSYSVIIREFVSKYNLIPALKLDPSFDPATTFSRCDIKTNSYTLIDGILISNSLSDCVTKVSVSHYGNNVSDHSPIEMVLNLDIGLFKPEKKSQQSIFRGLVSQRKS